MKYTIYKTTNLINNKIYIGKHQTKDINDDYLGSGKLLTKAIEKYGRENFIKEILYVFSTKNEMDSKEYDLVTEEFVKRDDTYNICIGGNGGWSFVNLSGITKFSGKHTKETKEKISKKLIGSKKNLSKEQREKRSKISKDLDLASYMHNSTRGKPKTLEHRNKISQSLLSKQNKLKEKTCPHCNKSGKGVIMNRWHFDNCKKRV